jgi:hypothetical protein
MSLSKKSPKMWPNPQLVKKILPWEKNSPTSRSHFVFLTLPKVNNRPMCENLPNPIGHPVRDDNEDKEWILNPSLRLCSNFWTLQNLLQKQLLHCQRLGTMVIASTSRAEDRGFESPSGDSSGIVYIGW